MSGFGADQGAGTATVCVLRSTGEPGKGEADTRRQAHGEAHPQARAGEDSRVFVEHLAEGLGGSDMGN